MVSTTPFLPPRAYMLCACTTHQPLPLPVKNDQPTQAAAKAILVDVGLWTRKHDDQEGVEGYGSPGGGEAGGAAGVIPWPAETLEAASSLAQERVRRGVNYDKRPPQGTVGAPAPFGR